jgi:hypothetical protein
MCDLSERSLKFRFPRYGAESVLRGGGARSMDTPDAKNMRAKAKHSGTLLPRECI